jgi:PTH1 family peptidyl-tRNA hydrolase
MSKDAIVPDGRALVVGLGNPGGRYAGTRHNVGFDVAQVLARRWGTVIAEERFRARLGTATVRGRTVVLMEPQTYMNLSGESVRPALSFWKLAPLSVIAVHDDIDLPVGRVRIKLGGGHGGHNGLRSLDQHLGTRDYFRVRLGVGRPVHGEVADWVLGRFAAAERAAVDVMVELGADAVEAVLADGLLTSQGTIHPRS